MPEECYVRVRLKFVPHPGTAEFGARVYDPNAQPGAANATMQLSEAGASILAAGKFGWLIRVYREDVSGTFSPEPLPQYSSSHPVCSHEAEMQ